MKCRCISSWTASAALSNRLISVLFGARENSVHCHFSLFLALSMRCAEDESCAELVLTQKPQNEARATEQPMLTCQWNFFN